MKTIERVEGKTLAGFGAAPRSFAGAARSSRLDPVRGSRDIDALLFFKGSFKGSGTTRGAWFWTRVVPSAPRFGRTTVVPLNDVGNRQPKEPTRLQFAVRYPPVVTHDEQSEVHHVADIALDRLSGASPSYPRERYRGRVEFARIPIDETLADGDHSETGLGITDDGHRHFMPVIENVEAFFSGLRPFQRPAGRRCNPLTCATPRR